MVIEVSKEKFKSSVSANLARSNGEMRDVLEELKVYNREQQKETPETKRELNQLVLDALRGNSKS